MITIQPERGFSSENGWNICLPLGWKVLAKHPSEIDFALDNIEVFAHPNDPSLSITWMRSVNSVSNDYLDIYKRITAITGSIPPAQAQEVISPVFPLIGRVVTAFAVKLADGNTALELTEEIKPTGTNTQAMRGYHLLIASANRRTEPVSSKGPNPAQSLYQSQGPSPAQSLYQSKGPNPAQSLYQSKGPIHMQQLVFYARASKFAHEIVEVLASARSYRST